MKAALKKWWLLWLVLGGLGLVVLGAVYVAFQLAILQPPVTEIGFLEKKRAQRYRENAVFKPISAYPSLRAGQATLFKAGPNSGRSKALLLLPDSGSGAWVFEKWLPELSKTQRVYAVSLRDPGARAATFDDYLKDARDALELVRQDARVGRVEVLGQGLGALLALKLAAQVPEKLGSLVLVSAFPVRTWSDQQLWLTQRVGGWAYSGVFAGGQSAKDFWRENFPAGMVQAQIGSAYFEKYAQQHVPHESEAVIREVVLGRLPWLAAAYQGLGRASFPVLQIAGRYDVLNPLFAQLELRKQLEVLLGKRYGFALLLSGRTVSLDWKWRDALVVLEQFWRAGALDHPLIQNEEVLDPLLDPPVK